MKLPAFALWAARHPPGPRLLWDELAAECWMTREYAKQCAHVLLYGGSIDPWLDSIVRSAVTRYADRITGRTT